MAINSDFEFWFQNEAADRQVDSYVHKFGENPAVGTTFEPVSVGGIYRTPTYGNGTKLRVKAGDADDTAAGTGARKIFIQGIEDVTGDLVSEELVTAGTSAGASSVHTYVRLFRAYVSESGTYATSAAGSQAADVVIENVAGSEDWLTIDATDYPKAQSQVGFYTVPSGFDAYIVSQKMYVDSNKTADIVLFTRGGVLDQAAPYQGFRAQQQFIGVVGEASSEHYSRPIGPYSELTDIGYMAKAAQSASASVNFEVALLRNGE